MLALAPPRSRQRPRSRVAAGAPGRRGGARNPQIPRWSTGVSGRRYYSPSQGRFLGRDPKGEAGGKHLYAFTENNPTNRWDYLGMDSPVVMGAVGNAPTKVEKEIDNDGCEWEVIYSDVSDVAYGIPDWMEIGRTKISCPNDQLRKECEGLRTIIGTFRAEADKYLDHFHYRPTGIREI
ncbi:MAG: RHS repeat-associated core domain-containing protein [Bacteroidota bacterium]